MPNQKPHPTSIHSARMFSAFLWRRKGIVTITQLQNLRTHKNNLGVRYTGAKVVEILEGKPTKFKIGIKARSMTMNPYLTQPKWPRTSDWIGRGPTGKPTFIILLREWSNKMTPSVLLLDPVVSASLSPHQRGCFLKSMGINTDTRQTMHRQ